jgi:hypothetical protein
MLHLNFNVRHHNEIALGFPDPPYMAIQPVEDRKRKVGPIPMPERRFLSFNPFLR